MLGNITSVKKGERKSTDPESADFKTVANAGDYRSYTYDDLSQLTREDNKTTNLTNLWTYDRLGNIQTKTEYDYTEETSISADRNLYIDYQYGTDNNTSFNKLLKNIDVYNGTSETKSLRYVVNYDAIGNPTSYQKISYDTDGTTPLTTTTAASLSWRGRQLMSLTDNVNSNTITYRYGADGLRKSKTVNGVKTQYYYVGDTLTYQICEDGTELYFFYDSRGALSVIRYLKGGNDYHFYVATNLQGDVVGIYTAAGLLRASYEYDAWGNVTVYSVAQDNDGKNVYTKITNEATSGNIGAINPIRYRGYYYDTETGFYYLHSRYYCPKIGRFLNADTTDVLSVSFADVTDKNLFAYCDNNPITRADAGGAVWHIVAGAVIGGLFELGAQLLAGEPVNLAKIGVAALAGGVTAAVGPLAGAAISGAANIALDMISGERDIKKLAVSGAIGAGVSLIGSGAGKVVEKIGGKVATKALSRMSKVKLKTTVTNLMPTIKGIERNAIKDMSYLTSKYPTIGTKYFMSSNFWKTVTTSVGQIVEGFSGCGASYINTRYFPLW